MIKLKVEKSELEKLFGEISHDTFQKALTEHWEVNEENEQDVTAQSVCWLFCWAKTGMNSQNAMKQSRQVFDKIFQSVTFSDFDQKVSHEWAREARYRTGNIEEELDLLIGEQIVNKNLIDKKSKCANADFEHTNSKEKYEDDFEEKVTKARQLTSEERLSKINDYPEDPRYSEKKVKTYDRNPYVVAEVLARAKGKCGYCKNPAPFNRIPPDGTPFLEVHHIIPLSDKGKDTIENAIALCPNCHRGAHYGGYEIKR